MNREGLEPPMARLRRQDATFLDRAPVRFTIEHRFNAPPERVFDALADTPGWVDWGPVRGAVDTSPPPAGRGSTRRVRVPGSVIDEEFFVWDRPRRWAFMVVDARPPVFRAAVEFAELTPASGGGTHLRYRVGVELVPALRPLHVVVRYVAPRILQRAFIRLDGLLGTVRH